MSFEPKKKFEAKRAELYRLEKIELLRKRMQRLLIHTKKELVKQLMLRDASENELAVIELTNKMGVNCIFTKLMRSGGFTIFSEWKKKENYLLNLTKKELAKLLIGRKVSQNEKEDMTSDKVFDNKRNVLSDEDKEILYRIRNGYVPSTFDEYDSDESEDKYAYLGKDYSYNDDMKEDWDAQTRALAMAEAPTYDESADESSDCEDYEINKIKKIKNPTRAIDDEFRAP